MYRNLLAEMVRQGITKKDIADYMQMRYCTVLDKLSGKYPFKLREAFKIKQKFFPMLSIDYLFATEETLNN